MFENYVDTHVHLICINNMIIVSLDVYERSMIYYLLLQKMSFLFREYKLKVHKKESLCVKNYIIYTLVILCTLLR